MQDKNTTDRTENHPGSSPAYANYVLGVLFIVYVFNFIDRQVLSVFIGPIKEEFGASDTQMGLLAGFAFALLYTFAGIPIARLADRSNRRNIIAIGLAVWSAMTVACGLARSFVHLASARVLVGIGEAAGSPPSHSLIADYFALDRRATALAIYTSGAFVGSALAYLGGGYLREYFDWRTAFIVVGAPGLLIALLVRFTVREPLRGISESRAATEANSTFGETLKYLVRSRAWVLMMTGFSLISITSYAILMWGYEFYGRIHALSPITIGNWMGVIVGVGGSAGTVLGGRLMDTLGKARASRGLRVTVLVTMCGFPLGVYALLAESTAHSLWCLGPFYLLLNVYLAAMYSNNQNLARLEMRATAAAIMLFIVNIVGAGAGPLIVGALSDFFAPEHGVNSIRYALVCSVILGALGSAIILLAGDTLDADLKRAHA
ncbi:MAG: MFS transporter [Halioglobus sp.]|nr:MFS transporter [Halioglobus sp.]